MSESLPKLPGFTFSDPTQTKFHLNHKLDLVNGYRHPKHTDCAIGDRLLDANSVAYLAPKDSIRYDPSLTYGRVQSIPVKPFIPHFALYDQKCLTFKAFFKQSVFESPLEHYRVRHVNIIYFLEDDSMTVIEPFVRNCGFNQGRLVKRTRIPKFDDGGFYHWKDLNNGIDIPIFGIVYHTVDCDVFTKEYLLSQGVDLNPPEDLPPDPYLQNRAMLLQSQSRITPPLNDKLRRFLEYDGKILSFKAAWDDRDSEYGEFRSYDLYYFLADDTVSVKEIHTENDGRDPFPLLLRKRKLPKDWKDQPVNYAACAMELSDAEVTEYYQPKDLLVGETVFVMGRRFLLYDCDLFTRNYYKKVLKIDQKPKIEINEMKPREAPRQIPPHVSKLGSLEDSMQSCFTVLPKRPPRDEARIMLNASKYLRFVAELVSPHPEDKGREFVISYSLADSSIKVNEPTKKNSGHIGGSFLRSQLLAKPGCDPNNLEYYAPEDFYIGAVIVVYEHRFRIIGADLYVYRYMQQNPEKFPMSVVENVRNYMYNRGYLKEDIKMQENINKASERQAEIDAIGANLVKVRTAMDKCLAEVGIRDKSFSVQKEPGGEVSAITENQPRQLEQYGISPMNNDCKYRPYIGDEIKSSECNDLKSKRLEPPCCLKDECPRQEDFKNREEMEKYYYDDISKRHKDLCNKVSGYYNRPCPTRNDLSELKDRKHVTFFENPMDPCASDLDDPCHLKIAKDNCDCTQY